MRVSEPAEVCLEQGYEADNHWAMLPPDYSWLEATSVAVDSEDRVYVFNRGDHPVMVFNPEGSFVRSWGEGQFVRPHGIHIGPDDSVYCTDDLDHTVRMYSKEGELLLTLGTSGVPSDTGATSIDYRTILRSSSPFYFPTNVAISSRQEIFVSDGYGNARIHRFSAEGRLISSWGEPGSGPGQFHVPHGIAIDNSGHILVADRENSRIQFFTEEGRYVKEWTNVARPCQVFVDRLGDVYVAELGFIAGMWPGTTAPPGAPGGRLSIFDSVGTLKARWGGGLHPGKPGDFFAPHDLCVDSLGNIYVAEVTMSAGGNRGVVPADCPSLQKFRRVHH